MFKTQRQKKEKNLYLSNLQGWKITNSFSIILSNYFNDIIRRREFRKINWLPYLENINSQYFSNLKSHNLHIIGKKSYCSIWNQTIQTMINSSKYPNKYSYSKQLNLFYTAINKLTITVQKKLYNF